MVSSIDGSPTNTGWNRRSSAGSFSMCSRYSSSVVAPTIRSSPRASIGLSMLPASIEPSALPAPTTVCSSSRKVMICPLLDLISSSTLLSRSSNCPRNCAPATMPPRSRATRRLSRRDSGTSPATIRWARPSTIAVLPTPGSPIRTGLFLVRRESTWMTRRISASRPMTGSTLPSRARAVRSTLYFSSAWYCCSGSGLVTRRSPPRICGYAATRACSVAPALFSAWDTAPPTCARPASRCSVETYSSPSGRAICSAALIALANSREMFGSATEAPRAAGRFSTARTAARRRSAGLAPTARSSPVAVDPPVSSNASSMCHASTVAWPRWVAVATAEVITSRLLVVRRSAFIGSPGCFLWTRVESTSLKSGRRPRPPSIDRLASLLRNSLS